MTKEFQNNAEADAIVRATREALQESLKEFPFTKAEALKQMMEPIHDAWEHPLVILAHKLLTHYKIVDDPLMLGEVEKNSDGTSRGFFCGCYYATVRFSPDFVMVFSNHGEGGMCPETFNNLWAIHNTPKWLKDLMPQLEEIAEETMKNKAGKREQPLLFKPNVSRDYSTQEITL